MAEEKPYAVLVGADVVRGLYAARNLSRHGVPLIGILKERWSPGGWSNTWDRVITSNTDRQEDVLETLAGLGRTLSQKAVLIPCFDTTVVDTRWPEIEARSHSGTTSSTLESYNRMLWMTGSGKEGGVPFQT